MSIKGESYDGTHFFRYSHVRRYPAASKGSAPRSASSTQAVARRRARCLRAGARTGVEGRTAPTAPEPRVVRLAQTNVEADRADRRDVRFGRAGDTGRRK